jgi:Protein of unknown function (DUF1559)
MSAAPRLSRAFRMMSTNLRCFSVARIRSCFCWFAVAVAAGCTLAICATFLGYARAAARESLGKGRLAQIGLALHNYHAATGEFPPVFVRDREGKPLHSWRVLILPYCELQDVYDRYDFNEAWNGPHNAALAEEVSDRVAPMFQCPNDLSAKSSWTTFLAITTDDIMVDPGRLVVSYGAAISAVPTIIEGHGNGIHWMEPRDLSLTEARAILARGNPGTGAVYYLSNDGLIWTLAQGQLVHRNSNEEIVDGLFTGWPAKRQGSR